MANESDGPCVTPETETAEMPQGDSPDSDGMVHSDTTNGAKTTTVFGALFGAAAAAPT